MTHSDVAYLVAVIVFIVAGVIAISERGWYAALVAAGLAAVAIGLLIT